MRTLLRALPALAFLCAAACGGSSEHEPSQQDEGLTTTGELRYALATEPSPLQLGQNAATLTITDAHGTPQEGCALSVQVWMPAHGHGSTETPAVSALGQGRYRASPLTFQMAGQWELRVQATCGAAAGTLVASVPVR